MGLIRRLVGDSGEAEDLWQEAWFSVWRSGWKPDPGREPWPYLRQVAVTRVLDHRRRAEFRPRAVTGSDFDPMSAPARKPIELDLGSLPRDQRAALVLFFWEGLSVSEIATVLGAPPNTVKTWMHRGRERLRASLLNGKSVR